MTTISKKGIRFRSTVADNDLVRRDAAWFLKRTDAISELLITPTQDFSYFRNRVIYTNPTGTEPGATTAFATTTNILKGVTVTQTETEWAYNQSDADPESQTMNQGVGVLADALRAYTDTPLTDTTDQTYTLTCVGNEYPLVNNFNDSTTINFIPRRYWGVSHLNLTTDALVRANLAFDELDSSRAVEKTFDASAGSPPNYLYFVYPTSWGVPTSTTMGGFAFSNYTVTTIVNFDNGTNTAWSLENYYVVRTNTQYNGAGIIWRLF